MNTEFYIPAGERRFGNWRSSPVFYDIPYTHSCTYEGEFLRTVNHYAPVSVRLVDLGGGNGAFSFGLLPTLARSKKSIDLSVVDIQPDGFDTVAPPDLNNCSISVNFEQSDLRYLRYPQHTFDAGICKSVLHFYPPDQQITIIAEAGRVLIPGAICLFLSLSNTTVDAPMNTSNNYGHPTYHLSLVEFMGCLHQGGFGLLEYGFVRGDLNVTGTDKDYRFMYAVAQNGPAQIERRFDYVYTYPW